MTVDRTAQLELSELPSEVRPIAPVIPQDIFYPSEDGEPLAETYAHLWAIISILEVLTDYLQDQEAMVLSNQFLYYVEGDPKKRVAPDVMVIFGVPYGPRDNYKIWEEGAVPSVVFEITSPSTKEQDITTKHDLYEQLGVQEYWLFDPKAEWIPEQLQGYELIDGTYAPLTTDPPVSKALGLRLVVEGELLIFYRLDNGDRLIPDRELRGVAEDLRSQVEQDRIELERTKQREGQAQQQAQQERARADVLAAKLQELGIDPDAL